MDELCITDIKAIVSAVSAAGDPSLDCPLAERKQMLLRCLAQLIGADVWVWSLGAVDPYVHGQLATINSIDGGWQSGEQRAAAIAQILDPDQAASIIAPVADAVRRQQSASFLRLDLIDDGEWAVRGEQWRETGLDEFLLAVKPLDEASFSSVLCTRKIGRPPFAPRDQAIMQLFAQVDWLHCHQMNHTCVRSALGLSPRSREALVHLLQGASKKEIAALMGISEHTVGDYLKQIYRHFGVRGRGQLFGLMTSGNSSGHSPGNSST